jgi:anti-anti-sigma factor
MARVELPAGDTAHTPSSGLIPKPQQSVEVAWRSTGQTGSPMTTSHLLVDHTVLDGSDLVTARGDLDVFSAQRFRDAALHPDLSAALLVLDLTDVTFLDSSGVGALVAIQREARARDAEVNVVCAPGPVLRVLTIMRLDQVLQLHETLDAAMSTAVARPAAS